VTQENFLAGAGVQFESTAFYYADSVPEPAGMLALAVIGTILLLRTRRNQGGARPERCWQEP